MPHTPQAVPASPDTARHQRHTPQKRSLQRGISLFIVIVIVMLSMLLALGASRTALFTEMIVGNDADYQRAFEAAQALLQDAEIDIRGERADGSICVPNAAKGDICRRTTEDKIPLENPEVGLLLADLDSQATKCRSALCSKRTGKQDFWNNTTEANGITLTQMAANTVGARYGQYTGAAVGQNTAPINPILADTSAHNRGGWYWIEVLPYLKSPGLIVDTNKLLALNLRPDVVYRITALAYGRKRNTIVVLQQTYAQQKRKD
ncbi:hypothetical protein AwPolaro_07020 [Polaromonas sp.]|nr:hypothetical protein AwPolaro_07020 [Polaromonas sp.]